MEIHPENRDIRVVATFPRADRCCRSPFRLPPTLATSVEGSPRPNGSSSPNLGPGRRFGCGGGVYKMWLLELVLLEANQGSAIHGVSETIVGVLGGGQLGRMLCQAASQMAVKVITLDPVEYCPACSLSYQHYVGRFDDGDAVREFAQRCEVLTIEIEHVDAITLGKLEEQGVDCQPKPSTIRIIQIREELDIQERGSTHHVNTTRKRTLEEWSQDVATSGKVRSQKRRPALDKYNQKVHFSQHEIPLPDFIKIDDLESVEDASNLFGFPMMLKSRRQAYDGRGNAVAYHKDEISSAVAALGGYERGLYAERWTSFTKELSVIVARGRDGSILCYPVVETIHKDSICQMVEAPADIPENIKQLSVSIAKRAVGSLEGAGVFAVELFLTHDGQVLLNEVAPRPHNSGHHTIESCYTSQYEQHLRAVIGLTLGDTSMKTPAAIMYNILGEDEGEKGFYLAHQLMKRALSVPGASIHWYGKPGEKQSLRSQHRPIPRTSMSPSALHLFDIQDFFIGVFLLVLEPNDLWALSSTDLILISMPSAPLSIPTRSSYLPFLSTSALQPLLTHHHHP
ncbi:hypothetical protein KSP40_PGU020145 [Platanthera guangdongensis]|uniref:ATP-grasp domain-containing protein n=1 Tax=Platanthera guangdongensis TaxID=2320717 RepID=A0ABR2N0Q8_9ASPA